MALAIVEGIWKFNFNVQYENGFVCAYHVLYKIRSNKFNLDVCI